MDKLQREMFEKLKVSLKVFGENLFKKKYYIIQISYAMT